jgi:hypothetical protein
MPSNNFIRNKGTLKRNLSVNYDKIQVAKVKSTVDTTYNGKLLVWLVSSNTNESLSENWISVLYASPFAGSTDIDDVSRQAYQSYSGTQKSYGIYAVPPDVNNYVLVAFANGDETQGYWFACIYKDTLTHMIPGIGSSNSYGGQSGPVAEMNVYSGQTGNPQVNPQRPLYTPLFNGLQLQGLTNDTLRGAGTSSVWRDQTPTVQGWLTPGGNQLILDDGASSQLIRLRTQSGAQILISETEGHIYIINKTGSGWVEINNSGNIYVYGSQSVSVRADADINLSAGGNVNIEGSAVNIQSTTGDLSLRAQSILNTYAADHFNSISPNPGTGETAVPPAIPGPSQTPTHEPYNRGS